MTGSAGDELRRLVDSIDAFLPPYLTQFDRVKLKEALAQFPNNMDYYAGVKPSEHVLQGDGWQGFVIYDLIDGRLESDIAGVILSNSCDINPEHTRDFTRSVVFGPIEKLDTHIERLGYEGIASRRIEETRRNIREQRITDIFYLPEKPGIMPEAFVSLDDVHSIPRPIFDKNVDNRLFSLSFHGFYLFLLKLSIHFTRMQEGLRRM